MSIWNKFESRDADCRKGKNPFPRAEYNVGKQAAEAYEDQSRVLAKLRAEREAREAAYQAGRDSRENDYYDGASDGRQEGFAEGYDAGLEACRGQ